MFAAGAGHMETARVLLDAGADVNAKLKATPEFLEQVCFPVGELFPPPSLVIVDWFSIDDI